MYEAQLNETGLANLLNDYPTPEERATAVEAAGIRSIIIPYELEEYNTVVSQLAEARNTLKVDTNAQVLSTLLRDKL